MSIQTKRIVKIVERLNEAYGDPRLGNRDDPLDELIFILLSNRSNPSLAESVFQSIKTAFGNWASLLSLEHEVLEPLIRPLGLWRLRARVILEILRRISAAAGKVSLSFLDGLSDTDCEQFLVSLPGVSRKVAKCVMMYSLQRDVLPVDVHVHRIAMRVGFEVKKRPDTSQNLIENAVPPVNRYSFHVNSVAHGRVVCVSKPRCNECVIGDLCDRVGVLGIEDREQEIRATNRC